MLESAHCETEAVLRIMLVATIGTSAQFHLNTSLKLRSRSIQCQNQSLASCALVSLCELLYIFKRLRLNPEGQGKIWSSETVMRTDVFI